MLFLYTKMFHIIGFVCWFAGLFYLPRLFVYHASIMPNETFYHTLCTMERKLYWFITTPSAIVTAGTGGLLLAQTGDIHFAWMRYKLVCVCGLFIFHILCGRYVKIFACKKNMHSHIFYRYFNEVPSVLLLCIVGLAVLKP